jgi:hypothetical protein
MNNRVALLLPILLIAVTSSIILSNPPAYAKSGGGGGLKQIPSLTTDYPDNNPNAIEAKTFKASKDIVNFYHVKGEIKNIGNDTLDFVHITAHLFDSNNQPVGTTDGYTDPSSLDPGHSGTFDALVDAKELSGKPTSYRLSFDWQGGSSTDNDNNDNDANTIPSNSSSSSSISSDKEQTSTNPVAGGSNTLQIPRSSSTSVAPSLNTTTATAPSPPQQQGSYLSYENPTYGFTIQYPSNWSKTEQPEAGRLVSFDDTNKGVQVYVKHDKLPSQYSTLTEYVNATANQIGMDRRDFGLMEYYPNLTIHNNPASKIVYLSTKKVGVNIGTQYETMRLWLMKGDDVYTLVYVTQPNLFPQYLPIANNMLKSFKITR